MPRDLNKVTEKAISKEKKKKKKQSWQRSYKMLIPGGQKKLGLFASEKTAGARVAGAKRINSRDRGKEMKTITSCYNLF